MSNGSSRINLIDRLSQKLEQEEKQTSESLIEKAVMAGKSGLDRELSEVEAPGVAQEAETLAPPEITSSAWHDSESKRTLELDLEYMAESGLITPDGQRNKLKEQYRAMKRPLLVNAFQRPDGNTNPNIIMVTSSAPNEGKTFTATNLAMSIAAEREVKVLLMDGDVIRQDLSRQFNVHERGGYLDILRGESSSLSDVIISTNIPSLAILPCGEYTEEATELFASSRMTDLMDDLATRYNDRVIILDTPPVLASSETQTLAMHAGQIVMVVEAGETPRDRIGEALSLLPSHERLYCVLNKANEADLGEKYAGYQSYYYR